MDLTWGEAREHGPNCSQKLFIVAIGIKINLAKVCRTVYCHLDIRATLLQCVPPKRPNWGPPNCLYPTLFHKIISDTFFFSEKSILDSGIKLELDNGSSRCRLNFDIHFTNFCILVLLCPELHGTDSVKLEYK